MQIRRASARFIDKVPGRATWHSFSFGPFYDPERVGFGAMICHDEHLLAQGQGFADHPHEGVDIVTYVVSGALRHSDSLGNEGVLAAGELGWLRAGSGVHHAEVAAAPATRFVQVWLQHHGGVPAWHRVPRDHQASPSDPTLALPGGHLRVLDLAAGERAIVPATPLTHVFVASGALLRHSLAEPLGAGDALLITADPEGPTDDIPAAAQQPDSESPSTVAALELAAATDAVLLVWTLTS